MKTIQPQTKEKIRKFVIEISNLVDNAIEGKLTKSLPSMVLEGIEDRLVRLVESDNATGIIPIALDPSYTDEKWLIWSIEHNGWWAPNESGYVHTKYVCTRFIKVVGLNKKLSRSISRSTNAY